MLFILPVILVSNRVGRKFFFSRLAGSRCRTILLRIDRYAKRTNLKGTSGESLGTEASGPPTTNFDHGSGDAILADASRPKSRTRNQLTDSTKTWPCSRSARIPGTWSCRRIRNAARDPFLLIPRSRCIRSCQVGLGVLVRDSRN